MYHKHSPLCSSMLHGLHYKQRQYKQRTLAYIEVLISYHTVLEAYTAAIYSAARDICLYGLFNSAPIDIGSNGAHAHQPVHK